MLACARPPGAKRPTPTQSTCLYYYHDNEASKCVRSAYKKTRLAAPAASAARAPAADADAALDVGAAREAAAE